MITRSNHSKQNNSTLTREALDSGGCLRFGKYKGQLAYDIARKDPKYLQWLADEVEGIDEKDRELLLQLLETYGRGK